MVSWATYAPHSTPEVPKLTTHHSIQTLVFTLGPLLLPKLLSYYRSIRSSASQHGLQIRPTPRRVRRALNLLFLSAVLAFLSSLPYFHPENIFSLTSSRLQIPTDVLFTRLSALRPLTASDQILRSKLTSLDARLQYLAFGPGPVRDCRFCEPDEQSTFLYYALPTLVAPHLLHIALLGLVTSGGSFSGAEAARWRTHATVAGKGLAAAELYLRATHDARANNARALRPADLDPFHWRVLVYRGLAMAVLDAVLAWLLWLAATRRAFVVPPSVSERLERSTRRLESAGQKLHALGMARNVVLRDERLRELNRRYWETEGLVMRDVFEDREVVDQVKEVLGRIDVGEVTNNAERYAEAALGFAHALRDGAGDGGLGGGSSSDLGGSGLGESGLMR